MSCLNARRKAQGSRTNRKWPQGYWRFMWQPQFGSFKGNISTILDPTAQNYKTKMNWNDARNSFKTVTTSRPFPICVATPICRFGGSISRVICPRVTMHNTTLSRQGKPNFLVFCLSETPCEKTVGLQPALVSINLMAIGRILKYHKTPSVVMIGGNTKRRNELTESFNIIDLTFPFYKYFEHAAPPPLLEDSNSV